jgi:tetratricopeptide (TPR) repeat protein
VGVEGVDRNLPARITTRSLTSARAFLEGEVSYREGRFEDAMVAYQESMDADTTFGLPVLRATLVLGWLGGGERRSEYDVRLAGVLDQLSARDRALATLKLQIDGDSLRSAAPALEAVRNYPDDAEAWYMLGEVYYHEPGLIGGGNAPGRQAFEKAIDLSPGFIPYVFHGIEYAIGAGDLTRAEALLTQLASASPDDPRVPQYELATRLFFGPLEDAQAEVAADFFLALRAVLPVRAEVARVPRIWNLLSAVPSGGEIGLMDLKSTYAMAAGKQQEALTLLEAVPVGSSVRVTLARHHQDLIGELPAFDREREYDAQNCGELLQNISCQEKVALHAIDVGRLEVAQITIARLDSIADEREAQRALVIRRVARTIEGYLAWKSDDIEAALGSLQEARRGDRAAVTARWFLAEIFVEAGRPTNAVDLFLSLDDSPTWSPFARLRVAEVLEDMGDSARAVEHYRSALSAWTEADDDFEPKTRASAGLTRVGG